MAKKGSKYYPVIRKFPIAGNTGATNTIIDIGKCLSKLNHRLYRQGRNYEVRVVVNDPSGLPGKVDVYAIAESWMNMNAYKLAYKTYLDATKEERKLLGKQRARWEDFRVYHGLDTPVSRAEVNPMQLSNTLALAEFTAGEFEYSEIETEGSGTNYRFSWGPAVTGVQNYFSIPGEYELQSNTDTTPTTVETDIPYGEVIDTHDADQYEILQENGNEPPYNANGGFAANPWNLVSTLVLQDQQGVTRQMSRSVTPYFCAPTGLIVLRTNNQLADGQITIEVRPGSYKGVSGDSLL